MFEKYSTMKRKDSLQKKKHKYSTNYFDTKSRTALLFMFNKKGHTSTVPTFKSCLCRHDICKTILFSVKFQFLRF